MSEPSDEIPDGWYEEHSGQSLVLDTRKVETLRATLKAAKTKLELYRAAHGGEYVGGVEFTQLIRWIDEALK